MDKETSTFAEITKPLKEAKKKIKEEDVVDLVHKVREEEKSKKQQIINPQQPPTIS